MSNAEKVALGTTLAGVNQYKVFAAVMNNFGKAVDATNEAMGSSGATARQNEVYMSSLEAKVSALKAEFEKFVIGKGGLQDFAKNVVVVGTGILKLINSLGGLTPILIALTGIIATIKIESIIANIGKMSNAITSFGSTLNNIKKALIASKGNVADFGTALNNLGVSASVAQLALGALTTVITLVAVAYQKYKQEQEEAIRAQKELISNASEEISSLNTSLERLNDANITREELNSIISSNIDKYEVERLSLLDDNEARKEAIELIEAEKKARAEAVIGQQATYEKAIEEEKSGYSDFYNKGAKKSYEDEIASLNALKESYIQMRSETEKGSSFWKQYTDSIQKVESEIQNVEEKHKENTKTIEDFNNALSLLNKVYDENTGEIRDMTDAEIANKESKEEIIEIDREFIDTIKEVNELTEEQSEKLEEAIAKWLEEGNAIEDFDFDGFLNGLKDSSDETNALEEATKRLTQAQTDLSNAMSNLTNMGSNYDTLTNAMNEFNNSGVMSLDTLSKLTALGSDWISILETENGVMSISEQGLKNLANSYIDDAEAKAYDKAIAELYATAENEATVAKNAGAQASNVAVTAARNAGNAIQASGIQAQNAATQWANAWNAVSQGSIKISQQAANNINKTLQTTINTLEKQRNAINKNVKAISSGTKATKSNSGAKSGNTNATKSNTSAVDENTKALQANIDALKKQKEALEKEIEEDEKVISIISKKLDEEIEKVEKIRDEEIEEVKRQQEERKKLYEDQIERIDDEIDALEKKKKAEEDYYNEQIDNLKKQNEALEDQLELEKLLQNLENAKNKKTRVYRKGKGFVYETDQDEVNKAQKELDEYYRKKALADQIQQLEDARDSKSKIYDEEIDDLKKYKEQIQRQYEIISALTEKEINEINDKYQQNIDQLKALKDEFVKMTKAYETELGNQLVKQKTGIDLEKDGWTERLRNLSSFVDSYNKKQKELNSLTETLNGLEAQLNSVITKQTSIIENQNKIGTTVGTNTGGGTQTPSTPGSNKTNYRDYTVFGDVQGNPSGYTTASEAGQARKDLKLSAGQYYTGIGSNGKFYIYRAGFMQKFSQQTTSYNADKLAQEWATGAKSVNGISIKGARCFATQSNVYATGVSSVGENQFAVVGDSPTNRELVIGSHLNGTAMQLQKGSGVVNAKSTNTLAGLLNHLGSFSGSNFGGGNGVLSNMSNTESMYIDKVVIEGSNITDVVSFKNSLMNLKSEATQRAYRHK